MTDLNCLGKKSHGVQRAECHNWYTPSQHFFSEINTKVGTEKSDQRLSNA